MFHRVKSETPDQPVEAAQDNVAVKEVSKQNDAIEIETDVNTQYSQEKDTQQQKEAQSMNQPDKDNQTDDKNEAQIDIPSSAYQRAGTAPASAGGYPGSAAAAPSYPGYGAANTQAPAASAGDRRLTIGAGITMSGEIESCDYLLVEGTVEAALKGANILEIAETGVFYGTVEIEDATIAGRFEGDITAQGRLVLREGATVTGTIAYKELEIEAGAIIDGKLTPLTAVASSAKPSSAAKEAKPAGKESKAQKTEKKPEPANTDGGLFSKAATAAE